MKASRVAVLTCSGLLVGAVLVLGRGNAAGGTRVPVRPDEVVARLPEARARDPRAREIAELRRSLETSRELGPALRLAELEITTAREKSDPRHLGRAQAALAPWWDARDAPARVLVLRATIEQSLHEFDAALASIDRALAAAPDDAQAWLTRAVILVVRGRHEEARASCAALAAAGPSPLAVAVCRASVDAATGDAGGAHARLSAALARAAGAGEQLWARSVLAEIAERAGREAEAEAGYRAVLSADPADVYTRAALADLLLDLGRGAEVSALCAGREADDGMLLRLAIAAKATGSPRASDLARELAERFAASRARGDVVHRREEARFELAVRGDAEAALDLAKANWGVQKEVWDARVLCEAALAARPARRGEIAAALEGIDASRLEHPHLARARAALQAGASR